MVLRFYAGGELHERHYFFCIADTLHPSVTRYSIAHSWLSLFKLGVFEKSVKKVFVFHDGGNNEYNNSSGLVLYSSLQKLWKVEFEVNAFISYHGKGLWDGLFGSAAKIMVSRSPLVELVPELHLDQSFYYRCLATIAGNAELSKAYIIESSFGCQWKANTVKGFNKCKKWTFSTSSKDTKVNCFHLSSDLQPFQSAQLTLSQKIPVSKMKASVAEPHPTAFISRTQAPSLSPPTVPPIVATQKHNKKRKIDQEERENNTSSDVYEGTRSKTATLFALEEGNRVEVLYQDLVTKKYEFFCGKLLRESETTKGTFWTKFDYGDRDWVNEENFTCRPCFHKCNSKPIPVDSEEEMEISSVKFLLYVILHVTELY
jgi:hypothetical protein